jgi:hypothetical protein
MIRKNFMLSKYKNIIYLKEIIITIKMNLAVAKDRWTSYFIING